MFRGAKKKFRDLSQRLFGQVMQIGCEPDLSNLHEKSLGRSPMVVTVSARYAAWGRFTATRPLTGGELSRYAATHYLGRTREIGQV